MAAGPTPAGAASATYEAATWANNTRQKGSRTGENAIMASVAPTNDTRAHRNTATAHHGRTSPIAVHDRRER